MTRRVSSSCACVGRRPRSAGVDARRRVSSGRRARRERRSDSSVVGLRRDRTAARPSSFDCSRCRTRLARPTPSFSARAIFARRRAPPAPPVASRGDLLVVGETRGDVVEVKPGRRIRVRFERTRDDVIAHLYRAGRPVQYTHIRAPLPLWDVQNVYASEPWAAEMPSAGRPLDFATLDALRKRGVVIARVTHGAGLSSIGDASLDASLPWVERYRIPRETADAVRTRALERASSRSARRSFARSRAPRQNTARCAPKNRPRRFASTRATPSASSRDSSPACTTARPRTPICSPPSRRPRSSKKRAHGPRRAAFWVTSSAIAA